MPQATIHGRPYGTGKRKNAIARVFLKPGEGTVTINGREFADYFPRETLRMIVEQPFDVLETRGQFDVSATVCGGGNLRAGGGRPARDLPRSAQRRRREPYPAQAGRLPHPRRAQEGAEEARSARSP